MSTGVQFEYGLQRLIDANQKFTRSGHPVYLRLRNFSDPQVNDWAAVGFSISPSGGMVGTTDVLIVPPPGVRMVSIHNIGQSNGKLRFGARIFNISATFVQASMAARSLAYEDACWNGPDVVGLVTDNLLFSIEDIAKQVVAGITASFRLTCNANEIR